jgi:hypothetical protein
MMPRVVFLTSILSLTLLAGCSHRSSSTPVVATTKTAAEPPAEQDPCSLLDPKEVEGVLGAPLATPPFHTQGGAPQAGGENCTYEDAGFHTIVVEVSWSGGAMVWRMFGSVASMTNQGPTKGMLHLADGSEIAGEWDEARVMTCCTFMALRGDQTVSIDIGGTTSVTIPQAAKLADAALKRLDKPLSIDGTRAVERAIAYETAHRPKHVDPCTLLSRAEAEAIMGPLSGDPTSKGDTCTFPQAAAGNIGMQAELTVQWTGGFRDVREKTSLIQGAAKGFASSLQVSPNATKATEQVMAGGAPTANPAWEASGPTVAGGFSAAKKDVLIRIESLGLKQEQKEKVLAQAMSKI